MTTTATAAVLHEPDGQFQLQQIELDEPQRDELLVRIEASGVCHTDMAARGMLEPPMVLGHEGTGVVEAVGSAMTRIKVGDRVVISYPWCGTCHECKTAHGYRCEQVIPIAFGGARLDGTKPVSLNGKPISSAFFQQSSFATHAITLERDVVPVSHAHATEMMAAIPCGIQTGAGAVLNSMKVGAQDAFAVFGTGAVGLSALMAGRLAGASPLIAIDVIDERLELAGELGATHTLNAKDGDTVARIKEIAPRGVNFSFNTTENEQTFDDAIECLAMGGECGIVTAPHDGGKFQFSPMGIFGRTATLRGIIQGAALPNIFLPKLIELQSQGRFPYERLITTYEFADINQAFADSEAGRTIKPVLKM